MDAVAEDVPHLAAGVSAHRGRRQRGQETRGDAPDRHAESGEQQKRRMPPKRVGQQQSGGDAEHGSDGKRGHHGRHAASAPVGRDHVAHDREHERPGHAAARAGGDPRREQPVERRGECACQRGRAEARIEPEQRAFAVQPVHEKSAGESCHRRRQPVGGDQVAELRGRDVEHPHEAGAERHHDHEIHDVSELHGRQREEHAAFSGGCAAGGNGRKRHGANG